VLLAAALTMIEGAWLTDMIGIGLGVALFLWQRRMATTEPEPELRARPAAE
jgi:hypothetical protein